MFCFVARFSVLTVFVCKIADKNCMWAPVCNCIDGFIVCLSALFFIFILHDTLYCTALHYFIHIYFAFRLFPIYTWNLPYGMFEKCSNIRVELISISTCTLQTRFDSMPRLQFSHKVFKCIQLNLRSHGCF